MKKIGLYVHIPFCESKCKYCDFNSYAGKDNFQHTYLFAIKKEISQYKNKLKDCVIDTIFIGGGTPSCLFDGAIKDILNEIKSNFNVMLDCEITIESNPNSISKNKALEWKKSGVTRVSVGLQCFNNRVLKLIGRIHNKKDYLNAMKILKNIGFNNINTDIMLGLPKQSLNILKKTIKIAKNSGCTHISVYSLIIEEKTQLYYEVKNKKIKLPKENKVVKMLIKSSNYLKTLGYSKYEVSNYSIKGFECLHNLNCWNMHEYLGIGAGSHSFFNNKRWNNVCGINNYINKVNLSEQIENLHKESIEDLFEETIMLGLRKVSGINLNQIKDEFNIDLLNSKISEINTLLKLNMIIIDGDYLKATNQGFLFLNKIIEMLI